MTHPSMLLTLATPRFWRLSKSGGGGSSSPPPLYKSLEYESICKKNIQNGGHFCDDVIKYVEILEIFLIIGSSFQFVTERVLRKIFEFCFLFLKDNRPNFQNQKEF